MPEQNDPTGQFFDAMMASADMEDRADYLRRGRAYVGLSTEAVAHLWTAGFKAWFHHQDPPVEMQRAFVDAAAELGMRDAPTPFATVAPEMEQARAEMRASDLRNPGVRDAIRRFAQSLDELPN